MSFLLRKLHVVAVFILSRYFFFSINRQEQAWYMAGMVGIQPWPRPEIMTQLENKPLPAHGAFMQKFQGSTLSKRFLVASKKNPRTKMAVHSLRKIQVKTRNLGCQESRRNQEKVKYLDQQQRKRVHQSVLNSNSQNSNLLEICLDL